MKTLVLALILLPSLTLLAQDSEKKFDKWPDDVCSLIMQGVGGYLTVSDSTRKEGDEEGAQKLVQVAATTLPFMT
ncbi:MAG: hypothetical protein VX225_02840 [Pseudomonadota bacterium]|nr:hypothetical protein [Pseudomonadota bacterium]